MTSKEVATYTDFLYARPSFIEGIARVADMLGTLQEYNVSSSDQTADLRGIRADWEAVGEDLLNALVSYQGPSPDGDK